MWTKLKLLFWQWGGLWITIPSITGLIILLRLTGLLQFWEWAAFDQYMRWRPKELRDDRIVIVGIDETDLQELIKQDYLPDELLAQLLLKLKARQPRAIGLDIYRHLPVEPGHQKLVKIFESTPNLIGIEQVAGEVVAAPPELKAKGQVGANGLIVDADEKVRRSFLSVTNRKGEMIWSLAMHLAWRYLNQEGIVQKVEGTKYQLGKTVFEPFEPNDGGYVRANASGYQILLNYRGPSRYFEIVSMRDILQDRVPPNWGRDRIILIGDVGEIFEDFVFTPYNRSLIASPKRVPRVEIHANLISQIISAAKDSRPLIKTWSEPLEWLWILLWSGVGAILIWQLRYTGGVSKFSFQKAASPILAAGAMLGSSYTAFLAGWWLPVVPPLLALFGSAIAITAYLARTAGQIRKIFGRYLNDQVVANLLESPSGLQLGGERRQITILTSDLRGFTAISERLSATDVVRVLNLYLGYMAEVITQYQGTIDEFMGDGILVLFGAPTARVDDAKRAVACAVAMQLAMSDVNERMQQLGLPQLEMGIGINTGIVVVGNIGSEKRTKYGIVGSQVNLTYRIESYTVGGQICLSESTFKEVSSILRIDGQKKVQMKGVKQPITIYEIGGIGGEYNLFLSKQTEILLPLPAAIPLQYAVLDEKHISDTVFKGNLIQLSAKEAEIRMDWVGEHFRPEPLSNIKLNLFMPNHAEVSEDIYAKVLERPAGDDSFYIHFTARTPDVEAQLNALYQKMAEVNR